MNKSHNSSLPNLLSDRSKDSIYPPNSNQKYKSTPYYKPDSVKQLEEFAFEKQKQKHPTVPIRVLVKDHYRDDTANGLTKCIVHYVQFLGGQAERINTMGRPIDRRTTYTDVIGRSRVAGSIEWLYGNTTKGSADISATIVGKSVKIEVKIGRDSQSAAQRDYQIAIEKAGGIYFIARDFTSFLAWYIETFKTGRTTV